MKVKLIYKTLKYIIDKYNLNLTVIFQIRKVLNSLKKWIKDSSGFMI